MKTLVRDVAANRIARVVFASLLMLASVGGLALTAYADQLVNGGVAWGPDLPYVEHTDVNPMGVNVFLEKEADPAKITQTLDMVRDGGFKWVRQTFAWNDIEIHGKGDFLDRRNPEAWVDAWAKYDRIVDEAQKRDLDIIARLDSPPNWARIPGDDVQTYHKGPPANNQDYADFVKAVATRYKGKIRYYQIWNEPNLHGEWGGHPVSPEEYTALLKAAYEAVKSVDPEAAVITAALAPTAERSLANLNDIIFLEEMYRAGAAPYFDIISTMLYGLGQSPNERRTDLNRLSFSRPILLREVMERNGDTHKPIWISEYAWISLPPDFEGDPAKNIWGESVDEETQGRWLVEGYERAQTEWPWMGVMAVWHFRQPDPIPGEPANYFAIVRDDFTPRPAYEALKEYSKSFPPPGIETNTISREKPLWNAWGFPIAYGLFALLAITSGAYALSGLGRWAQAVLDRPRGRYSEATRELARNAAAVVGMGLLVGLYYRANSLPLVLATLAGLFLIAFLKPSTGLAAVVVAIPFFWYPKTIGRQSFPIAETLILLVFAALITRRVVGYALPGLARRLNFAENEIRRPPKPEPTWHDGKASSRNPTTAVLSARPPDDTAELIPATWPARPTTVPLTALGGGGTKVLESPVQSPEPKVRIPETATRNSKLKTQNSILARFIAWNRADPLAPPAVALLILGALSLLWLADPAYARDSARAYRWVIVEPVLFYFLITDIIVSKRGKWRLADFFVATAVAVSLLGIWQFATDTRVLDVQGVSRVFGPYQHPNNLALYLGRVLPFAACAGLFLSPGWRKIVYLAACLPLGLTLFLTFSRGAYLAVAVAIVICVAIGLRWRPGHGSGTQPVRDRRLLYASSAALALGVALIVAGALLPTISERIVNLGSANLRIHIWETSLDMLADHPITGVGPDQFLNQFRDIYHPPELEAEKWTSHPHNLVLDYWLTLGIMGVPLILWLLWRYFREALGVIRRSVGGVANDLAGRALALGLLASMLNFLVHGLVDNSYFLMDLALIFWLCCGLLQLERKT